jgi:hypothetical protein
MADPSALTRMQTILERWFAEGDRRDVFLRCYSMMTANMHAAIDRDEFSDGAWVARLLHRFADYYFDALAKWEQRPESAPPVWQLAHASTRHADASVWQHLLLGVNAHINYDLVLTVHELLQSEWQVLAREERERRFADYGRVNDIIAATIDAVQDDVIAPAMPVSAILDRLMGRIDEYLISRLISSWRDRTWDFALELLQTTDTAQHRKIVARVEEKALRIAAHISLGHDISSGPQQTGV